MGVPPVVEDVSTTVVIMFIIVLLGEGLRRCLRDVIPQRHHFLAMEAIFTCELCLQMLELSVLSDAGKPGLPVMLPLIYATIVTHCWSATCALCNPTTAIQHLLTSQTGISRALEKISFQLLGGYLAWVASMQFHKLGLTKLHAAAGSDCTSHLHTSIEEGLAVELACAFVYHSALNLVQQTDARYRVHIIGVIVAILVGAAGQLTGAMFNPALAFSLNFFCQGSSFTDNVVVYWVGPIAGMILSVGLFDHLIPAIKRLRRGPVEPEKTE
ncbi:aquaporin-11 isoform X1 [Ambystoma mexicanum]|uniref:aquaporin-11 isoform X1 n=1 Tax=Ambystoma mexicanum TaxID=8296 RepID=UPI0037E82523